MPIPTTPGDLRILRAEQVSSLEDRCVHMPRTAGKDPRNNATIYTWPDATGPPLACGFDPGASKDVQLALSGRGSNQENAITTDARLRVSLEDAAAVRPLDKMRVTAIRGEDLETPQTFSVAGYPELGPTGAVLNLSRVEL
jgi:hypothetical protein